MEADGNVTTSGYLRPEQVEAKYGISKALLARLRFEGKGPRYRKPTPKTVLYRDPDIVAWIEASARQGTAPGAR